MAQQKNNGRVDTLYGTNYNVYDLFRNDQKPSTYFPMEAVKGVHSPNDISKLFFSKMNIDALQDGIRYQVYLKTNKKHVIDRQSDTDLKVIMRSVYLENARHDDINKNIIDEIRRLNKLVIDIAITRIIQEINMYMRYREDITNLPVPLERGQFSSNKGTKVLIQKDF